MYKRRLVMVFYRAWYQVNMFSYRLDPLHKPDGLMLIDHTDLIDAAKWELRGSAVNVRYQLRLSSWNGIYTRWVLLREKLQKQIFRSIIRSEVV